MVSHVLFIDEVEATGFAVAVYSDSLMVCELFGCRKSLMTINSWTFKIAIWDIVVLKTGFGCGSRLLIASLVMPAYPFMTKEHQDVQRYLTAEVTTYHDVALLDYQMGSKAMREIQSLTGS